MKKGVKKMVVYTAGSSDNAGESGLGIIFCEEGEYQGEIIAQYQEYCPGLSNHGADYKALLRGIEMVINYVESTPSSDISYVEFKNRNKMVVAQVKLEQQCNTVAMLEFRTKVIGQLQRLTKLRINYRIDHFEHKGATKLATQARKEKMTYGKFIEEDELHYSHESMSNKSNTLTTDANFVADTRMSWDEYFVRVAFLIAQRSSCFKDNRKVGAVLVKNKRIIATGYNGAPTGITPCIDKGYCMRLRNGIKSGTELQLCWALHAEMNTLLQCAVQGVSTEGATLYVTHHPCSLCSKMLIQAGVREVVYCLGYPDGFANQILVSTPAIFTRKLELTEEFMEHLKRGGF